MKSKVHLNDIIPKWKSQKCNDSKALIFSPYITSPAAEDVTNSLDAAKCEIYTLFSAELFINQSSSIKSLIGLKKRGFALYALPNLHAKIFLNPDSFASIGSQNLTVRGRKQLEAAVLIQEPELIKELKSNVDKWCESRIELTLFMLEEMEKLIEPVLEKYDEILQQAKYIDTQITELKKSEQRRSLKQSIASLLKSSKRIRCRVKKLISGTSDIYSLCPDYDQGSLLKWRVGNDIIDLVKTNRYLLIYEDTGKIGWARIGKTRITFIGETISRHEIHFLGDKLYRFSFNADWEKLDRSEYNVKICIEPYSSENREEPNEVIEFMAWFGVSELKIGYEKILTNDKVSDLVEWIEDNKQTFEEKLLKVIMDPFKYDENLYGDQADVFFGYSYLGPAYQIQLAVKDSNHFLIVKKID